MKQVPLSLVHPGEDELNYSQRGGKPSVEAGGTSLYFALGAPDDDDSGNWLDGATAHNIKINLLYFDVGTETIQVAYSHDAAAEIAAPETVVTKTNTGTWKRVAYTLAQTVRVGHSVYEDYGSADLRFVSSGLLILNEVRVRETTLKIKAVWQATDGAGDGSYGGTESEDFADTIQSDNFVAGVSGWQIQRDTGDAEFENVILRGTIYASAGQIANWDIGVVNANTISTDNGNMRLVAGNNPYISGGNNAPTSYLGDVGFWIGRDAGDSHTPKRYKFHIGDPSGQVLYWDGANLYDSGQKIDGGKIGKWKISGLKIKATNDDLTLDADVPSIQLNNALVSGGALSGSGFWVGKDTAYKLFVGNSAGAYMFWNGTKLVKHGAKHKGASELGDSDDGASDTDVMTVYGHMQSDDWVSGVTGTGWRISNAGRAVFRNIVARGSIRSSVFEADVVSAVAGTMVIAKSAGKLDVTMSVPASGTWTMSIEDPPGTGWLFANSDIIRVKETQGSVSETWFTVTRGAQSGGHQTYTCTFASGNRPVTYEKGIGVLDYGQSGHGFLELSADGTNAPYYSTRTHAGAPWTTVTERVRLGNLTGITDANFGALSGYGLWTDNVYLSGSINATAGLISGVLSIGASGGIYQGTGSFASPTTGLKIYNSSGVGLWELWGSGTKQAYADSTGKLVAGAGNAYLDASGLTVTDGANTRGRFGNLNGVFGYTSNLYGIAVGDYTTNNYLVYDTQKMLRLHAGDGVITIDRNFIYVGGSVWEGVVAGTAADDASVGTAAWSNPSYATTEDGNFATATVTPSGIGTDTDTHYLKLTNWGFSIPSGATVTAVRLKVKAKTNRNQPPPYNEEFNLYARLVKGGTISGNTAADSIGSLSTTLQWIDFDQWELWGLSLAPSDVNASTFGVAIYAEDFASSDGVTPTTFSIDAVVLSVYYRTVTGQGIVQMNGNDIVGIGSLVGNAGASIIGGTASGNNLTLKSTSHATKGKVIFGNTGTTAYDEVNERVGIGTAAPNATLDLRGASGYPGAMIGELNQNRFIELLWDVSNQAGYIQTYSNAFSVFAQGKNFAVGVGSIATNATDGFMYITSCAGTPTGVPTDFGGGHRPMVWDRTNKKLYVYDGGWVAMN